MRKSNRLAYRVAYIMEVGPVPDDMVLDHVCHNRRCVNPKHLRLATKSQNCMNRVIRSDNTSGYTGVCFFKPQGKWAAYINGKFIGYFNTVEDAARARAEAATNQHGAFAYRRQP